MSSMTVEFAEAKHLCHTKFSARSWSSGFRFMSTAGSTALARITRTAGDATADAEGA